MAQSGLPKIEREFDRMAGRYDKGIGFAERRLLGPNREWATSCATGRVVEIAVGTGLNLPFYGPAVDSIIGVDLSAGMLALARRRVQDEAIDRVELRHGDVQRLDVPDESVDTVVSTLSFCTIPDPLAAAREAMRVLRPGGRIVVAEHGPSRNRAIGAVMRLIDPLSVRLASDHLCRVPGPYLTGAGFVVEETERAGWTGIVHRMVGRKVP